MGDVLDVVPANMADYPEDRAFRPAGRQSALSPTTEQGQTT